MERALLVIAAISGFLGVAAGAFGAHALRPRLPAERIAWFETAVRYQVWHALALFAAWVVGTADVVGARPSGAYLEGSRTGIVVGGTMPWPAALAGGLFVAGTVLFSGSLYALALTGRRSWARVAPLGGACFLLGWASLALAGATA
ncbi:MAG: hypothetical protein KatS3mg014_1881 [Actinomycetota bacterium]|nr:MAG: hypothetical protein KatS3mg014_1881 [Actinomycetota bacterium]